MIRDKYRTVSTLQARGSSASKSMVTSVTLNTFLNDFGLGLQINNADNELRHQAKPAICDPYGWKIMLDGLGGDYYDENALCEDIVKGRVPKSKKPRFINEFYKYVGEANIYDVVNYLRHSFVFNVDSFVRVYRLQGDIVDLLNRVLVKDLINYHHSGQRKLPPEGIVHPSLDLKIPTPKLQMVLDAPSFPVAVCGGFSQLQVRKHAALDNFGEGTFVVDNQNNVVDCLRINDFWLLDQPLDTRLKFMWRCKDYETKPWFRCWNMKEVYRAAKDLGVSKTSGVLIRSLGENYYKNYWLRWNKKSLIFCEKLKNGEFNFRNSGVKNVNSPHAPMWHSLDKKISKKGESKDRIWMDEFDYKVWNRITKL